MSGTQKINNLFIALIFLLGFSACHDPSDPVPVVSADATLSGLSLSAGDIDPVFVSGTTNYMLTTSSDSTTVTPMINQAEATVTVDGTVVTSGSASGSILLPVGDTIISIVVTAEDGVTNNTYNIIVTRDVPLNNNADLADLSLSVGSLTPAFDTATLAYTSSVSFTVSSLSVTPTLSDTNGSVTVNGSLVTSGVASAAINLAEGENTISLVVLAEDNTTIQTYTLVVSRQAAAVFAQQAYIKASNTDAGDLFGVSMALDGDTLAVGARDEDSNATGIGGDESDNSAANSSAVYVFTRSGGTWAQQAYIKASNADAGDLFGYRLALDGDTLAVGAFWEDSSATGIGGDQSNNDANGSGAVYVFTRSGSTWTQQAYIKASNTDAGDVFSTSLDLNGDTLAVGAFLEDSDATGIDGDQSDNSANRSGAVYVFTRSGTVWTQQAYIKGANTEADDFFGGRLALDGDTLAVAARDESSNATGIDGDQSDNSANSSGAVYVFTRSAGSWAQQAYIKASNTETSDLFGSSLALNGDTLAVGAGAEDSNATGIGGDETNNSAPSSGAVYVFTRSGSTWTQQAYIKASNTDAGDVFSTSLDLNGNTLAVGAAFEDSNATGVGGSETNNDATQSGAVYLFTRSADTWTQQAYVKASNTDENDGFGGTVSLDGDTLAVTAALEASNATGINGNQGDNSASRAGAVYVFDIPVIPDP